MFRLHRGAAAFALVLGAASLAQAAPSTGVPPSVYYVKDQGLICPNPILLSATEQLFIPLDQSLHSGCLYSFGNSVRNEPPAGRNVGFRVMSIDLKPIVNRDGSRTVAPDSEVAFICHRTYMEEGGFIECFYVNLKDLTDKDGQPITGEPKLSFDMP